MYKFSACLLAFTLFASACGSESKTADQVSDNAAETASVTPDQTMTVDPGQVNQSVADAANQGAQAAQAAVGTQATDKKPAPSAGPANSSAVSAPTPAPAPQTTPASTGKTTTVKFDKMLHDFGKITDGDEVKTKFKFTNTGSEPLVIKDAKGSCGCTVPDYPKAPIAPGETGEIEVKYNSKGKGAPEGKDDNKTVTLTANTPSPVVLRIKANVTKKD
jgi:hypothetical protein